MGLTANRMHCGVVEWVHHGALKGVRYVMRMNEGDFVKRVL